MAEVQRQVSSGLRVERPSDDPVATGSILRAASGIRALGQYRRNLGTAESRLQVEDTALNQLSSLLTRARELGVGQAGANADSATRAATGAEVDRLIEQVYSLANTQVGDHYVFGGLNADRPPLPGGVVDPDYPPAGEQLIEIGQGQRVTTTHSADEIFLGSGVVQALQDLRSALSAGSGDQVQTALVDIDTAFDEVQTITGALGARINQVNVAQENLESLEVNLQTFRSGLEDVEMEKAVTELVARQSALQAAMAANASLLQNTLADFL